MPVVNRRNLRHNLGLRHLRDTITGNTTSSFGSVHVIDRALADTTFTAEMLHYRSWARFFPTGSANGVDFRVASFNCASGALISLALDGTTVPSGAGYEVAAALSPADKDRCLDLVLGVVRVRREVGIQTTEGLTHYPLDGVASPHYLFPDQILDCFYYADPSHSLNRAPCAFDTWEVERTATGHELRVSPALGASQQIVLDGILSLTLGAAEVATINIPDEEWVLLGAEAHAWNLLMKRGPAQETKQYADLRRDAAFAFSKKSQMFQPRVTRPLPELEEPGFLVGDDSEAF